MGIIERRTRQRQAVKEGILQAAREIASEGGWTAVTIRKIADQIEYSPPVIYEHFVSKDEILVALMRQGYAEQLRSVEVAAQAASCPEAAMLGVAQAWLDFAFGSPDLYQVMYGLGGVPFSAAETRKEGERIADAVGRLVEQVLREHDAPTDDIDGKVTQLWSTMHGLVALTMVGRIPGGQEEAGRLAKESVRSYVTAWTR